MRFGNRNQDPVPPDLLYVGIIGVDWVAQGPDPEAFSQVLPLGADRPASEALTLVHGLFPDSVLAVTNFREA
jgi:hypothetical protein